MYIYGQTRLHYPARLRARVKIHYLDSLLIEGNGEDMSGLVLYMVNGLGVASFHRECDLAL